VDIIRFCDNAAMMPYIAVPIAAPQLMAYSQPYTAQILPLQGMAMFPSGTVPEVPFYSQFQDIASPRWQKVGCGIASLAMVIDFYKPDAVSVNALLGQGIAAGAYDKKAGWIYDGLIRLSQTYGLDGTYYDLARLDAEAAFAAFKNILKDGPVILAVHYQFNPKSAIPHLVVINGIANGTVYYNDPAAKDGGKEISVADFLKGWKKKIIAVRPVVLGSGLRLNEQG
jgi:predicted double-glycine peptidase